MRSKSSFVWISALALAVSASLAVAAMKPQSKHIELLQGTSWKGTKLPPGDYKIVWQEEGTDLKVSVVSGKQVVVEGRGRIEERPDKARVDAVVSRQDGSGQMALAELLLGGKKEVLVFAGS